jgi:hypothetical protein
MQITFEQAWHLPVYYSAAYRTGNGKRHTVYFTEHDEVGEYMSSLGPEYERCIPCNQKCDGCGACGACTNS